jgi:hypothetical protein
MAINEFGQLVVVTNNAGTDGSFALLDVNFGGNIIGLNGSAIVDNAAFAGATDIVIGEDGYAYVATNSEIRIVDLNGANPTLGGTLTLSNTTSLYIDEFTNNLYAVTSAGDLAAYDISSTPGTPAIIDLDPSAATTYSDPTNLSGATDLIVTDNTAFVSTANGIIVVILDGTSTATFGNIDTAGATTFDQNAVALATDEDGFIYTVSDDGAGTNYLVNFDLIPDGLKINGLAANDYLGMDIASAGDVNSDGYADFLISIPTAGGTGVGEVHLVYGDEHLMDVTLGVNTFEINGIDVNTNAGDNQIELTYMGDFNGGGASDFGIVEDDGTTTTLHLFYGETAGGEGSSVSITASDLEITEAGGDTIIGGGFAGDFNADGFDDFVVVVDTGAGTIANIYVIYGSNSAVNLDTSQFDDTNSFYMSYDYGNDLDLADPAFTITSAGDLNGDGFEDILIGLPEADNISVGNDSSDGSAVAVYGRDSGPNNVMTDDDGFGLLNTRWAMNETTGTTVGDDVGASNLTYVGGASVSSVLGFLDGALSFNGSSQYATVNSDPGLSTNFTLSAWVNRAGLGAMTIASAAAASAINDFNFGFNALNQLEISFENQILATTTTFTTTSDWHHYSVAFDGANVFLYVDGILEASAAFASPFTFDSNFNLATGSNQASDFLNGSIDDVRVYSDALDADKINYLFNNLDGNTNFAMLDASQNSQTLVGTSTGDTMSDNGYNDIGFKGGGGDDSIYISNSNFNFIDGGTGTLDTLYLQGAGQIYDLRPFGSESIVRLEAIDLLDADQILLMSDANLMNMLSSADGGYFTLTDTGGNGIILFEGQSSGPFEPFSKAIYDDADFAKLTDSDDLGGGTYDFGSAILDISAFSSSGSIVLGTNFVLDNDANDLITAGSMGETLIADNDDDVLNDGFQSDISMFGFAGSDTFDINSGNFSMIDGGFGTDTINFVVDDGSLDLSSFADYEINKIEAINAVDTNGGGQTITLTLENIFSISFNSDSSNLDLQSGAAGVNRLIINDQDGNNESGNTFADATSLANELDLADDGDSGNDSIYESGGFIYFNGGSHSFFVDANFFSGSNVEVV